MRSPTPHPRFSAVLLAAVTALPLLLGGATAATAGADDGPGPGGYVPESALVPGSPLPARQPYQRTTPDQGAFPPRSGTAPGTAPDTGPDPAPRAAPDPGPDDVRHAPPRRRTPDARYADPGSRIEYVPPGEQLRAGGPEKPGKPRCSRSTGPYQRFAERYLGLEPDGVQSPADCRAIQAYQTKAGIHPDSGFAGPVTWRVMNLEQARAHPGKLRGCPRAAGVVGCLDLNRQMMWVTRGDRMIYRPVPIRSGKPGYETRTGWQRVYQRVRHEHSRLYDAPMPFSQYFNGGQALHGVYDDLFTGAGSHGCVNLRYEDAEKLWKVLKRGDRLYIWGRKPNR